MSASVIQNLLQSYEMRVVRPNTLQKVTAKVKRKYHSLTTFSLGYFGMGMRRIPNQSVFCYEVLANETMKPAKLGHHLV